MHTVRQVEAVSVRRKAGQMVGRKVTDREKQRIGELHRQGLSYDIVAIRLGLAKSTVQREGKKQRGQ